MQNYKMHTVVDPSRHELLFLQYQRAPHTVYVDVDRK